MRARHKSKTSPHDERPGSEGVGIADTRSDYALTRRGKAAPSMATTRMNSEERGDRNIGAFVCLVGI